jgi:hypothetical protein
MIRNGQPIITRENIDDISMIGPCPVCYANTKRRRIRVDSAICLVHEGRIDHVQVYVECANPQLVWRLSGWAERNDTMCHGNPRFVEIGTRYSVSTKLTHEELLREPIVCPTCRLIYGLDDCLEIVAKWHPEPCGPASRVVPISLAESIALVIAKTGKYFGGINSLEARHLRGGGFFGNMGWAYWEKYPVVSALRIIAVEERRLGWTSLPEEYREAAVAQALHCQGPLPEDLLISVPYQAYYYSLPEDERDYAESAGTAAIELPGIRRPIAKKDKRKGCHSCGGTEICGHCRGTGWHHDPKIGQVLGKKCRICGGSGICRRCRK